MNRMPRLLPAYVALALVVVTGLVHGFWTHRWFLPPAALEAAGRLEKLPTTVGDWQAEPLSLKDAETEAINGHLYRRYVNRANGAVVQVLVLSGQPGPVAIHTPDICYRAGGFDVATPIKYRLPGEGKGPAAQFWTADLHKKKVAEEIRQRIFWAWSVGKGWKASDDPRGEYRDEPVLFKLYLVRDLRSGGEPLDDDPCLDLMRQLLPQMQQTLFPSS